MFVVQLEYEIVGEGFTESCEGFDKMSEARLFAHNAIDEICNKIQSGVEIDSAAVDIWYVGDGEIAEDNTKGD